MSHMRENQPEGANYIQDPKDVKNLGVLITTTGVALLINADNTLEACQTLAASRPAEQGLSGPVDCVELLNESEGVPFVGHDEDEPILGVDMWVDDEGLLLDSKHLNPFASIMAGQEIHGDVVLFGSHKGETMSIPWPAFEKIFTSAWIDETTSEQFVLSHPTRGYWTIDEARVVIDSLDSMGRFDVSPSDEPEEVVMPRFVEQGKRNTAATMFALLGFEADEYRCMMDLAAKL